MKGQYTEAHIEYAMSCLPKKVQDEIDRMAKELAPKVNQLSETGAKEFLLKALLAFR